MIMNRKSLIFTCISFLLIIEIISITQICTIKLGLKIDKI